MHIIKVWLLYIKQREWQYVNAKGVLLVMNGKQTTPIIYPRNAQIKNVGVLIGIRKGVKKGKR